MFFKKSSKDLDILPPPPPFPELKLEGETIGKSKKAKEKPMDKQPLPKPMPKIKGKIKLKKDKKQKVKADAVLERLRKKLVKKPKHTKLPKEKPEQNLKLDLGIPELSEPVFDMSEIGKPISEHAQMSKKQSFFDHTRKSKISDESRIFDKKEDKKKAKEEKRKAKEERKKQKKTEKELAKQKHIEKREKIIEEKTKPEREPFELFPQKIEKPPEIFKAEHEINKAIKDMRKKKKKPLFNFLKAKKEQLPKPGIKTKTIPKEESPEKLPALEIKAPTDEVNAIKHKIHDARSALMDLDIEKAKILYIKIMRLYHNLSPEKQALVYDQIKDLYNERRHAEGLKFKQ